jgi:Tfp pilus assembly protein PilP
MTITILRALVMLAAALAATAPVRAQEPPAAPPTAPQGAQQAPPPPAAQQPPASSGGYSYRPDGRRDPFVSLLGRASDPRSAANRPTGLAGLLISEVVVTGIVKGSAGYVATLRGPDNRSYIVRTGERLMDGTVKSISERQVVFSQDVNDPLSLIKQREIPKSVRPGGESRE